MLPTQTPKFASPLAVICPLWIYWAVNGWPLVHWVNGLLDCGCSCSCLLAGLDFDVWPQQHGLLPRQGQHLKFHDEATVAHVRN